MDAEESIKKFPYLAFGIELERVRREAGLETKELAAKVHVATRTAKRYLNGERMPTLKTISDWENACQIAPGSLMALHPDSADGGLSNAEGSAAPPQRHHNGHRTTLAILPLSDLPPEPETESVGPAGPRSRRLRRPHLAAGITALVAGTVAVVAIVLTLVSSGSPSRPKTGSASRHAFPSGYTGTIWIRLTAGDYGSAARHVNLRWGPLRTDLTERLGSGPVYLATQKSGHDSVPLRVGVAPAADIAFGQGKPPSGGTVRPIDNQWTTGP
ncbi:MAG: helix-turn-helix transcriptional regulator [Solirubrobacteraceae bacterium]